MAPTLIVPHDDRIEWCRLAVWAERGVRGGYVVTADAFAFGIHASIGIAAYDEGHARRHALRTNRFYVIQSMIPLFYHFW
jgi:hypothetical protein